MYFITLVLIQITKSSGILQICQMTNFLSIKDYIWKNVSNQAVYGSHWLLYIFFPFLEDNGAHQLFG